MQFSITCNQADREQSDCIVVAVRPSNSNSGIAIKQLNNISNGYIDKAIASGAIAGKFGQTLLLYDVPNVASKLVLLINCEDDNTTDNQSELSEYQFKQLTQIMINCVKDRNLKTVSCFLAELKVKNRDLKWQLQHIVASTHKILYTFNDFKSNISNESNNTIEQIQLAITANSGEDLETASRAINYAMATAIGVNFTKDLANSPPNVCTPSYLAEQANHLAKEYSSIRCEILETKDLEKLGMNAMLSVAKGSSRPPKFIVLQYKGAADPEEQPIALIGKGITIDTGGISLKPSKAMMGMKYDMSGAASVLGSLKAAAELDLPINIVVIVAATENMPGGNATTPDSVITSMAGITVEILNTDAEGRLVLSDALEYVKRFNPKTVIDVATLTGACVVALGNHYSGMFSNNDALAKQLIEAGDLSGDVCWRLPLGDAYQKQIESKIADIANIGSGGAGSITAACFLERFAKDFNWAHLDVAGTAYRDGDKCFARGRPVPLLVQYLINQCDI